jgi:uncharacterized protein (TIGR03067 family)
VDACQRRYQVAMALDRLEGKGQVPAEKFEDQEALLGDWVVVSFCIKGMSFDKEVAGTIVTIRSDSISIRSDNELPAISGYRLKPNDNPPAIDLIEKGDRVMRGIYSLDGKTLKLCFAPKHEAERPTKFESSEKSDFDLLILKRKE